MISATSGNDFAVVDTDCLWRRQLRLMVEWRIPLLAKSALDEPMLDSIFFELHFEFFETGRDLADDADSQSTKSILRQVAENPAAVSSAAGGGDVRKRMTLQTTKISSSCDDE